MKATTLILLALAACAAAPHRVCSVTTIVDKGSSCDRIGHDLGPQASDVGLWHTTAGGVKWCMSTLDPKAPLMCTILIPSPADKANEQAAEIVRQHDAARNAPKATPPVPTPGADTPLEEAPKP